MNSQQKRIDTVQNRYGVTNVAQLADVQDKRRATFESKRNTAIFYQEPRINLIDGHTLQLYRISKDVADSWLDLYHPFKHPRGNVLCLGLVANATIYCLITFKKSRDKHYNAELSRMWMLPTYNVIDGYDILSKAASEFGMYNIVAYVNMSFENYRDYESIGMKHVRDTNRTKWWIKEADRISDPSRRQRKLSEELMLKDGWLPVYDCGQRVYEF